MFSSSLLEPPALGYECLLSAAERGTWGGAGGDWQGHHE